MATWEDIRRGIFAGESGGDYDALFGYANRPGGKYEGVKLTDMSVNDVIEFSQPSGEYGNWVKGQVGRVATPMGAYQIVGTTLRDSVKDLGLTGEEKFDEALQERLGQHIYSKQGTGAWEGYKGPMTENEYGARSPKMRMPADIPPMQDPMPPAPEGGRPGRLPTFANNMALSTDMMTQTLLGLNKDMDDMLDFGAKMIVQPANSPLTFGSAATQSGNATLPNGAPLTPGVPVNPAAVSSNSGGTAQPTAQPTAEPPAKEGFASGLLSKLFPQIEDPAERRMAGADMLAALSTGLGQMSGGDNVDLSNVFNRMQLRQEAAARTGIDAANADVALRNAQIAEARLGLDMQKHDAEMAKYYSEADGYTFSPGELEAMAADPLTAPFVSGLSNADPAVRKASYEGITNVRTEQGKERLKDSGANPQAGNLYEAMLRKDDAAVADILNSGDIDPATLSAVMKMPGVEVPTDVLTSQHYLDALENNPPLAAAMEARARQLVPQPMSAKEQYNFNYANEKREAFTEAENDARRSTSALRTVEDATLKIMENPKANDKGTLSGLYTKAYSMLSAASPEAADKLAERFGLDVRSEESIQSGASTLALLIARPLMKGQGTVTEGERETLLRTVASGNMTPETRLEVIARMRALDEIDRLAGKQYKTDLTKTDNYGNAVDAYENVTGMAADVSSELARAAGNSAKFRFATKSEGFAEEIAAMGPDVDQAIFEDVAPRLTAAQYEMFKTAVPMFKTASGDIKRAWIKVDPITGEEVYMTELNGVSKPYTP